MFKRLLIFALLLAVPAFMLGLGNNDVFDNTSQRTLTTHGKSKLLVDHKPYIIPASRDLLFDQNSPFQGAFAACQADSSFSFYPRLSDNFTLAIDADIDSIVFWGGYWNTGYPGPPLGYNIEIYPDSGGGNGPCQNAIYAQALNTTVIQETQISGDWCVYEGSIPPFSATAGEIYWFVTQMVLTYPPQFGTNVSYPPDWGDGQQGYFKSAYFGYPTWVPGSTVFGVPYENGFQLFGSPAGGDTFTWDFEDGWQDWTHTNGLSYPGGWDVIAAPNWPPPNMDDSCLGVDDDAANIALVDTAISPVFQDFAEDWLHWGIGYNYYGGDWVSFILRYFDGSWNQTTLVTYTSDMGGYSYGVWDSVDVSGFTGDTFQLLVEYNDGGVWAWWCEIDNIGPVFLFPPLSNDMAAWSIDWPPTSILINTMGDPTATFRNVGGTQATFDAHFEIDTNGVNVYTGNVQSITLDPGIDTTWVFSPQWTAGPTEGIQYNVTAYCVFPGDENPGNDTIVQTTTTTTITDWIQCANMPAAKLCHATCYDPVGDYIFALGGGDGTSYYNTNYRYDPNTDSWTTLTAIPVAINWIDASAVQWNHSIYIFGGYDGSFHNYNYIYDITGDSWSTGAAMPGNRIAGGQVVYNDSLVYFLCGHNGSAGTNTVYIYDTYLNTWTTGTTAPTTSYMMSVAMTGDTIWLVQTYNGSSCNANMYMGIIDPANCQNITWSTGPALPVPNFNGGGTQNYRDVGSYVYEVGGFENAATITAHAWEYSISGATWNALPDYPMTICRNDFLTYRRTPSDAEIYVAGGDNSGGWTMTNQVWKLAWMVGVEEEKPTKDALVFGLSQNVPNPFTNGQTQIAYATTQSGPVSLKIYDNAGRLIRTLVDAKENAGRKTVTWDGKDNNNHLVAAGVYFYRLTADGQTASRKMVVVR